ncbi:hypothetical protein K3495_g5685 [Podosphaera aphanis]|nr:hypothetical protein K3495_g5685 [Podosphaera aphanis]
MDIFFWNSSAYETDTDKDSVGDLDENTMNWKEKVENHLRGSQLGSSRTIAWREKRRQQELMKQASKTHNIVGLFKRQKTLEMSQDENQDIASNTELYPLSSVPSGLSAEEPLREALKDLSYLMF